jgi:hypothetical protein
VFVLRVASCLQEEATMEVQSDFTTEIRGLASLCRSFDDSWMTVSNMTHVIHAIQILGTLVIKQIRSKSLRDHQRGIVGQAAARNQTI